MLSIDLIFLWEELGEKIVFFIVAVHFEDIQSGNISTELKF